MLDNESDQTPQSDQPPEGDAAAVEQSTPTPAKKTAKKSAAKKTPKKTAARKSTKNAAEQPAPEPDGEAPELPLGAEEPLTAAATPEEQPAKKTAAKKTAKKSAAKKTTKKAPAKKTAKRAAKATDAPTADVEAAAAAEAGTSADADTAAEPAPAEAAAEQRDETSATPPAASLLFQAPDPGKAAPRKRTRKRAEPSPSAAETETPADAPGEATQPAEDPPPATPEADTDESRRDESETGEGEGTRRRRRRGGRRRRKGGGQGDGDQGGNGADDAQHTEEAPAKESAAKPDDTADESDEPSTGSRRRRRRRRSGDSADASADDPANTVVRVREPRRSSDDEISGFTGSTRLEAKKQRRREGREAGRRRAPIVSEAEFLARRESVERSMVVRQRDDLTQIAVLEDKMLVEHYVARESQTSLIGNVYLGRVQNVLPSMEAAFIDIGKGRNAVLYAGEVNWDALGKDGQPRRIETALKSGQPVLVQVTKDPVGHKGARLTSQISLPGRYLVYVPGGQTSGISRKLPDTERNRLKNLLKEIIPDEAGVIIRTAAEGASEEELRRDVARLTARWADIEKKVEAGQSPSLLYGEPDLTVKVIRDLFTEDFAKLVVSGDDAWDTIEGYVGHVAPDLMDRVERWDGQDDGDVFASYRVDEQIAKGLDRKVFLPSGGSLVIDRTEAMTVVDVNTGKFTGSGGNLEETVTKNNLEAAEEIVRQLRLRDIGGIIVIDFIDMVLESNRDLVLRRLVECLGRDRTKHQVAEVTSLGLVQMTRKRIGTGLVEAFSESCEHCAGRGLVVHHEPVEPKKSKRDDDEHRRGKRGRRRGGDGAKDQPKAGNGDQPKGANGDQPKGANGDQPTEPKPRGGDSRSDKPSGKPEGRSDDAAQDKKQGDKLADAVPADNAQPEQARPEPAQPEPAQPEPARPAPVQTAQPEPAQHEPAQPAASEEPKPKRTRRRAGRPQGQPDEQSAAPVAEVTPATNTPSGAEPTTAPAAADPAPAPEVAQPAPAPTAEPAPRRTRRRAASRPAGPPQ